jgi:hypothetical protein
MKRRSFVKWAAAFRFSLKLAWNRLWAPGGQKSRATPLTISIPGSA